MIYNSFARVYSELMDDSLYAKWANYVRNQTDSSAKTLLDVACGTGDLTILLANDFDVTGTDLSEEMLNIADEKANQAKVNIPFEQSNMMDLYTFDNYDVITCFDDSICYLGDEDELYIAAKQAYDHLNDGGKYLFDAHSLYQMDEVFPGYMFNHKAEDSAFMWSSYEGEYPHSIEHELTFFNWDDKIGGYKANTEIHHERTYPIETFLEILKDVGFKNTHVSAEFGESEVKDDSNRWFFASEK
ncbi:class I SAM-dependent DNA methyltransferase [Companilactobacillus sp.]|uniref:class I SAM-dependent DNA methyltransferase n=1 Tax=Companilactobacillus sp. TaxID=2767905 RepID=UPI0025B7CFCC|nr:class I SAM-dependent methyltransferase [Companilactobacillus sp.]MCH4007991.1 class I SAM-dependent methyltransferase [Companilactobacillus sp.]MCH4051830.1 class I SAM-dependent methyltransferase [Companilactobacillus sp.]MCH4075934.1 class I SAM-dependent methyltransferase [Companilactobacillus sp.]MCH4124509.1 class I SAM-dependent methyltransferase [Companilactobacillus sp.]MCH4132528.1 class I SAM-dependent methyltransferase [Companilactobacillus sp.]